MGSMAFGTVGVLLLATLLPATLERGLAATFGFVAGVFVAWRSSQARAWPSIVVKLFLAGAVGAAMLPVVTHDALPRLLRRDFAGVLVSAVAGALVWLLARSIGQMAGVRKR